ncbi:MAG: ABC transporter ATP-binding protein/permease [Clostridiales bacterium]|nr:ABC transporter ATP-binding protein/permease [Clostridiales bacterium]
MRIFKSIGKKGLGLIFVSIIFIVFQVWLDLKSPDYMQKITLLVTTQSGAMSDILDSGGKMLLCCLGSLASSVVVAIFVSKISADFSANLRERIYDKVQSFSLKEMGLFSTSSLITRSTNDITQIQMLIVLGLQVLIKAPITAVWAITKIAGKNWQWTLSTAVAVLVLILIVGTCLIIATPKFRRVQSLTDDLNRVTRENLTGIRVVRAYNAEKYQEDKFERTNKTLTNTHLFAARTMAFMMPSIYLVMNGITLAIYWVGAYMINSADLTDKMTLFSEMSVFSAYAMQVVMAFMMLIMIFMILPRATVSIKRINEVLDTKSSIVDGTKEITQTEQQGEIEFKNVSFKYNDAEGKVLENISFKAHKGETVAIIGATGCGKSTLVNLIPRFYDPSDGEVLVDGINVKEYTQHSLHNKIGYVSQKSILFSGTIKTNIDYGDNGKTIAQSDIDFAVQTAQADEFVNKLPNGTDSYVAQGGTNYSGGQKQRLSIARAIARNAEILIFDDSFSALDYATDRKLRSVLKKDCKDATKIIVAQRIGTIRDADRIIVLDDGKTAGIGTHSELMQNCEVYRQIAYSQLSKEEAL